MDNDTLLKLKKYLKQNKWSLYKLAKESDIPYSSLNNLFQRNTEPTLPTLRKICTGLGISLSDFFSDEVIMMVNEYSQEERKLIQLYRSISKSERALLFSYGDGLLKKAKPEYLPEDLE